MIHAWGFKEIPKRNIAHRLQVPENMLSKSKTGHISVAYNVSYIATIQSHWADKILKTCIQWEEGGVWYITFDIDTVKYIMQEDF